MSPLVDGKRVTSAVIAGASAVAIPRVRFPVCGLLERGGNFSAKVILSVQAPTLKAITDVKVAPHWIVYSDKLNSYTVLDVSGVKHFRINHSELFSDQTNHINGIENFWNKAKRPTRRLALCQQPNSTF